MQNKFILFMNIRSKNGRIHKFKKAEPIWICHLLNFKIQIHQYTTTLCSYQQKPKVDQRKAKKVLTQNWGIFFCPNSGENKTKRFSLKTRAFFCPNSVKYQKVKKRSILKIGAFSCDKIQVKTKK